MASAENSVEVKEGSIWNKEVFVNNDGQTVELINPEAEVLIEEIFEAIGERNIDLVRNMCRDLGFDRDVASIEDIKNAITAMVENGLCFRPESAKVGTFATSVMNYGKYLDSVGVEEQVRMFHPNQKEGDDPINVYRKSGSQGLFVGRYVKDGEFLNFPKAAVALVDIYTNIVCARNALRMQGKRPEEVDGMMIGSNGALLPNFVAIVADCLGLRKDCILHDSHNGCGSVVIGEYEFQERVLDVHEGGFVLVGGTDNFVHYGDKNRFYLRNGKTKADLPPGYETQIDPETGEEYVEFDISDQNSLNLFSAGTGFEAYSLNDYRIIEFENQPNHAVSRQVDIQKVKAEMKKQERIAKGMALPEDAPEPKKQRASFVQAVNPFFWWPKEVPTEAKTGEKVSEYTDPHTGRTINMQVNDVTAGLPVEQHMGTTSSKTPMMALEVLEDAFLKMGLTLDDIKDVVFAVHQANARLLEFLEQQFFERYGIPKGTLPYIQEVKYEIEEGVFVEKNFGKMYGNASAAAIPIARTNLMNNGHMGEDQDVIDMSVGYSDSGGGNRKINIKAAYARGDLRVIEAVERRRAA
jgi:hypothetical protein